MQYKLITKKEPEKSLLFSFKKRAGRARNGRLTVRHQGGGAKRIYRMIDFGQEKLGVPAKVIAIEYDPNRNCLICLLEYQDKEKRYVLAAHDLKVGDEVICAETAEIKTGNRLLLKNIPVGTMVFNVELEPGKGGKMIRSAGNAARIVSQEGNFTHLIMPSSEIRKIPSGCFATVGQVSLPEYKFIKLRKAGDTRHRGIRPTVRGNAMNPRDHPHGGGVGKSPIGMPYPKTPWGKPAKGVKTRNKKWIDRLIIQRRK